MGCMKWLKRHLTEIFCVLFLSVVVGVVAMRNYTPGIFLTGIDNFHIEFDLSLALSRAWIGVWQENQGLGMVSGLAQMTELPRVAIYQILSWVLSVDVVRSMYVFGNLYLGVIGVFFLTWYLSKSRLAALAGALFYLFNLGTMQVFFMPTDMFVANYGALPWLFLLVFKYLIEGKRVSLLWYVGLLFLFAPMAMTPTIFVVYLLFFGIICFGYLLSKEKVKVKWKRIVVTVLATLGISLYFLLPFSNFALNNARSLTESKINRVFSQENYLMNSARTSWGDLITLKGMWFDYPDNVNGKFVPLMSAWQQYLVNVGIWIYVPVIVMGIGIVAMFWKKKWQGIMIVVMGVLSLVLLRGENPPLGIAVTLVRSLPLVAEAFRTPYTKIVPILTLVYAVCFGYGIYTLGQIWKLKIGKVFWKGLLLSGVVVGLISLNLLYFQGKFINEGMRVKMPNEYFEMFKFFKTQDKYGRIVRLPAYSPQAWDYADWGYRGSGFLWYGIEQPILDRAFDVWSPYNETFYNEFSTALYGEKKDSVVKVLQKYDVRYVLLDESVIAPGQDKEILRLPETKALMEELGAKQVWQENFLTVWDMGSRGEQFVSALSTYTMVNGDVSKVREDVIFDQVGTYISENSEGAIVYPFASLMREETKGVEYEDGKTTLSSDLSFAPLQTAERSELLIPGWKAGDIVRIEFRDGEAIPAYALNGLDGPRFLGKEKPEKGKTYLVARVSEGSEWNEYLSERKYSLSAQTDLQGVTLKVEVAGEPFRYDFEKDGQGTIGNCDVLKRGVAEKLQGSNYVADGRGAACDYVSMTEIDPRMGYLMRVQGDNLEGRSLKYFLYNTGSKRNDIEWLMNKGKFDQTFSLLPWSWDGYYTLNIETRSFGQKAENEIVPVEVRWFPLEQIVGARIESQSSDLSFAPLQTAERSELGLRIIEVHKTGTWLYKVKVEGSGLLKLSQGYDEGWIAPPIKHVKVDGWANGWIIGESQISNSQISNRAPENTNSQIYDITIFYWPQLLEYLGFAILGVTIWLVMKRKD